ncbi:hypothetical protein F441_11491 [Phytophthora nicotianae CJ01A1]|uniref:Uncharacterized protein n=5 Tax=Phytophthora nicotianae TaxID=4792 RepID=V9EX74_PHYNI|nr:hypothetical protein F443_11580 [Phytophthora nicotianae P1569]ETK83559.1 hypothetical protein L915_11265 [Phytophthora nicotianae]ETO72145.1 hypothetical protein F444_11655 [Phytophthora nicotianae P1976]ETP13301.1 hypothetical protein F441_11491 [Phytophthora nicotianae CJ01A1]ETP41349.1 hypothetical protein F442_11478 [Phytophthora nicotianae P10297]
MAARFSPQEVMETEVKRRLGAHVQRRGDGFTEAESMGMLQLVRSRWREGWDVIAQLHNAQFAKHNRSADSLKKKFSRLYRSNIPPRGAKNHQAITFAHIVHKEMIEGVPAAPGTAVSSVDGETPVESSEASFQPPQGEERTQEGAAETEHNWVDTAEVPAAATSSPAAVSVPATVATPPTAASAPRPRARVPRQTTEWQSPAVFPPDATPLPTDDLLTSVLKVILRSQYQRDLDREEERQRRDEERQRRREEAEQRRQEEDRRRDEEREERRRRSEERAEERAENRRRHEQFMQMMTVLVGKNSAPQQRDTEC